MTVLQSLLSRFRRERTVGSRKRRVRQTTEARQAAAESLEQRLLLTNPDIFHSNPGAPVTIYLDFDGHSETDASWVDRIRDGSTAPIVNPAYDVDGDPATFNQQERDRINEIYQRVAEDFIPFNIDVTTELPASFPVGRSLLISVGGSGEWTVPANGQTEPNKFEALSGSFANANLPQSAFVFQTAHNGLGGTHTQNVAASISQAVAVSMGLRIHEPLGAAGTPLEGDDDVAPILGDQIVGDDRAAGSTNSVRDIWYNAPVSGSALQDDLSILDSNPNVNYRVDDHGDSDAAATGVTIGPGNEILTGIIERSDDLDVFTFTTAATNATVSITGLDLRGQFGAATPGSNLDPVLTLRDSSGAIVASADGADLQSSLTAGLTDGSYFIEVSNRGEYGNLGAYTITIQGVDSLPAFANPVALNSNPGAPVDFYLGFAGGNIPDGHSLLNGAAGPVTIPAFDTDGDIGTFTPTEVDQITEIWARVAEDFRPFDVNVTTVDPGGISNLQDARVLIGGDGSQFGNVEYLGLLNSFSDPALEALSLTFSDAIATGSPADGQRIAYRASAALATTLGLGAHPRYSSFGVQLSPFDSGTSAVGPILGSPDNSLRDIWVNAPGPANVSVFQDDLALITSAANGINFRVDDHGDGLVDAEIIDVGPGIETLTGIIETQDDVDVFGFSTLATTVTVSLTGLDLQALYPTVITAGSNLDPVLELVDAGGVVIESSDIPFSLINPNASLTASVSTAVEAGTYYIQVSNRGEYGNLGEYTFTLEGVDVVPLTIEVDPDTFSETDGLQAGIGTVTRPVGSSLLQPITVDLRSGDPNEVIVPATVTIPAGALSASFDVDIQDDARLDGDQRVSIQAFVLGVLNSEDFVTVTDVETLSVTVTPDPIAENAGTVELTVTRSNDDVFAPNHWVTVENELREYDPTGTLVSSRDVEWPGGGARPAGENARDVQVLQNGQVAVYNGTLNTSLSIYNPITDNWNHFGPVPGLSASIQDGSSGGLASVGNYVFLTDSEAFTDDPHGMVRINTLTGDIDRFGEGTQGSRLFAMGSSFSSTIYEFNPVDGDLLNTISLPITPFSTFSYLARGIAFDGTHLWVLVDDFGTRSGFEEILKLDPNTGALLEEHSLAGLQNTILDGLTIMNGQLFVLDNTGNFIGSGLEVEVYDPVSRVATGGIISPELVNGLEFSDYIGALGSTGTLLFTGANFTTTTFNNTVYEVNPLTGQVSSFFTAARAFQFEPGLTGISDVTIGNTVYNDLIYLATNSNEIDIYTRQGVRVDADPSTTLVDSVTLPIPIFGDIAAGDVPNVGSADLRFRDVTIGFDGLLYGLLDSGDEISVHDPETLVRLRGIVLDQAVRTIAVGDSSGIYAGASDGSVIQFDLDGVTQVSTSSNLGVIVDIEVNIGQEVLISDAGGNVVLTSQSDIASGDLTAVTPLETTGNSSFVSFGRHPTRSTGDLVVTLTSSDLTELQLPATVTIPVGEKSVTISVPVIDDNERDGDQVVTIDATSTEHFPGTTTLTVTDFETVAVDVIPDFVSEDAGVVADAIRVVRSDVDGPYDAITNQSGAVTTPIDIVDDDVSISQIQFPSQVSEVTDLNVTLSIAHNAIPDLDLFLISPSGTRVKLFTDLSSNGSNLTDTILDDEAANRIVDGAAPYTGRFIPEQLLSTFDGENPSGHWSLEIIDDNRGDNGQLLSWSIQMTTIGLSPAEVTLSSNDLTEATVQTTVTIPVNQSEVLIPLTAINDDLLDGPQTVSISVDNVNVSGLIFGADNVDVTDGETIQISVTPTIISENAGDGAAVGTVTRTDMGSGEVVISLSSSDTTELTVPATVTIPDGVLSATFMIKAVDDLEFDGNQDVVITGTAAGYLAATSNTIQVTDQEPRLQLSTITPTIGEDAGAITITIARLDADDLTVPQLINLSSSDLSEVTVPATVEIPAGEVSTSFSATIIGDELLDGSQPVTITAVDADTVNPVVNGTSILLTVDDAETITITSDIAAFAENVGVGAATATLTISAGGHTGPLFVNLFNSDNSEVSIPSSVIIPDGETSVTFPIDALDDPIIDPRQMVQITAQLLGFRDGVLDLIVNDYEPPIPTGPSTTTEDPTPTLSWAPIAGATRYDLWVNDTSRNIIQLFRSENLSTQAPFFTEDFSTATFDASKWAAGTTATIDGLAIGEPGAALHLDGSVDGSDELESVSIDLSGLTGAKLSYGFQQTGRGQSPISQFDLVFSYRNAGGVWVPLSRQLGADADMTAFENVEVDLPAEALHDNFAFRIGSLGNLDNGQPTADWFVSHVAIGVDGAVPVFSDDFESGDFDSTKWSMNTGAEIDGLAITANSETITAHFAGSDNGVDRLESVAMDLTGRVGVQFTYTFQQTGRGSSPEASNDLVILYRAENGDWVTLDRQLGSDPDMTQFRTVVVQLPEDALHDNFAFRIEGLGPVDDGDPETPLEVADWFVDSVSLANYEIFTPTQELGVGRYRFWVRAYDEFEQATAWSRGRDFLIRTRPQIVSPANQRFVAADTFPEVSWTSVVDTARYDLWINNVTTGESQVVRETNLQTTSFASELAQLQGGTYRAWVRAIGPDGLTGFWSGSSTFTVLTTPQNVGPTGTTFDRTPELRWDAVPGAASYYVWLTNRNPGGTAEVVLRDRFVTNTFRVPDTDLADGTYALWVQALAADGTASKWSPATEFIVGGRPQIVSPANNTLASSTPTFLWTGITGTDVYEVWVDRIDVPTRRIVFNDAVEVASYTVPSALPSGTYRLWVRAISEMGEKSLYSAPVNFTVASVPNSQPLLDVAPKASPAAAPSERLVAVSQLPDTVTLRASATDESSAAVSIEVVEELTEVSAATEPTEEIVDSVMAELAIADWWTADVVAKSDRQDHGGFAGAALGILASSSTLRRRGKEQDKA